MAKWYVNLTSTDANNTHNSTQEVWRPCQTAKLLEWSKSVRQGLPYFDNHNNWHNSLGLALRIMQSVVVVMIIDIMG